MSCSKMEIAYYGVWNICICLANYGGAYAYEVR